MRKVTVGAVLICMIMIFGCGKKVSRSSDFTIVASFYPVYIVAKNLTKGIEGVSLVNMTPPMTGCLHDYNVTADDMKHLERANLFLVNGAGMESFMEKVCARFPSLKTAELAGGISLIRDATGTANPHIWVNPGNMIRMVHNCADQLSSNDPAHQRQYRENEQSYTQKLSALNALMQKEMQPFRGQKIVTFHEAFPYFAAEYGLVIAAVVEREPGSEPSAKELAATIDLVKKSGIKYLFAEPQYPSSAADAVARETGANVYFLDPAVTGPDSEDAYIDILKKNLEVLKTAFRR